MMHVSQVKSGGEARASKQAFQALGHGTGKAVRWEEPCVLEK